MIFVEGLDDLLDVLEHVADAPPVRRHEHARTAVVQRAPAHDDAARSRTDEFGDDIEYGRLARAGGADQRDEARIAREFDVEQKVALPVREGDFNHVSRPDPAIRRVSSSEATTARSAMAMAIRLSRSAPFSPPGTCV